VWSSRLIFDNGAQELAKHPSRDPYAERPKIHDFATQATGSIPVRRAHVWCFMANPFWISNRVAARRPIPSGDGYWRDLDEAAVCGWSGHV